MKWIVNNPDGYATSLKSFAGSNLTLLNSSGVDVYYSTTVGELDGTAPGLTPVGTKIAAGGGREQFFDAPENLWLRSFTQTTIDVQADATNARAGSVQTVYAGMQTGGLPNRRTVWDPVPQESILQRIFKKKFPSLHGRPTYPITRKF